MKKLAIFDLDGTLIDSLSCIGNVCNKALEKNGLEKRSLEEYKYYAGDGALELVKRAVFASGDKEYKKLDEVYNAYQEMFEKDCIKGITLFDGVYEILKELKQRGIKMAILSNKPHKRTLDVVDKMFEKDIFDYVLGYKDEETKKPSPYGALLIARELGIKPQETVYIGDTDTDMKTGKSANMYTVGVTWGFRDKKELEKNKADVIIDKVEQILTIFDF